MIKTIKIVKTTILTKDKQTEITERFEDNVLVKKTTKTKKGKKQ